MTLNRSHFTGGRVRAAQPLVALTAYALAAVAWAQQDVPFRGGIPVAPEGIANRPLLDGPFEYPTAEGQDIRVAVLTKALNYPYAIEFLPEGTILVTERRGLLRMIRNDRLVDAPVEGGPPSFHAGVSGLPGAVHGYMNLARHPEFETNSWLYLSYTKPLDNQRTTVAVGRGRWSGDGLAEFEDVWVAAHGAGGPTPFVFGHDGMLYIATSGGNAQDPMNDGGKVLRLHDDGTIPHDNPFVGKEGYLPAIYTLGHRNALGLTVHPITGDLWQSENGPNGGDEINVLRPGRNYGWPIVSLGRTYQGPWQHDDDIPTHDGFEPPVVYWMPAIAVSGLTFYFGDALPKWRGDLFVGGLRYGEIPGTGRLDRVLFNQTFEELRRESLLLDLGQRIRDVAEGPDGLLYVVTDEEEGAVLRIEPAKH